MAMSYKEQIAIARRRYLSAERGKAYANVQRALKAGAVASGFRTNGATMGPAGKPYAPKPPGMK